MDCSLGGHDHLKTKFLLIKGNAFQPFIQKRRGWVYYPYSLSFLEINFHCPNLGWWSHRPFPIITKLFINFFQILYPSGSSRKYPLVDFTDFSWTLIFQYSNFGVFDGNFKGNILPKLEIFTKMLGNLFW